MSVKVLIESTGPGVCALTGKESPDGLTVAFENEQPRYLSWKAFQQLLGMKAAQRKPAPRAQPVGNGNPQ